MSLALQHQKGIVIFAIFFYFLTLNCDIVMYCDLLTPKYKTKRLKFRRVCLFTDFSFAFYLKTLRGKIEAFDAPTLTLWVFTKVYHQRHVFNNA